MKRGKSNQDKRRKEERKLEKYNSEELFQGKWIIIISVAIVFLLFYLITVYITGDHEKTKNNDTTDTPTSSSEILLGRSFSMKSGEYLVLYYDSSDEEVSTTCEELFTNYEAAHGEGSIYYVDMNSGFNKAYVAEGESNKNPTSSSELSISGPTLMKVNENKMVDYIEGIDSITSYLES